MRTVRGFGAKRDLTDHRDHIFNNENVVLSSHRLPGLVDLTPKMPGIYDQSALGSCTGNGWARVFEYQAHAQGQPAVIPSRLFIYYNERVLEGSPLDQDTGAEIRTGAKVVAHFGAPPETDWAYDINRFAERPPQRAYDHGKAHEALAYQRIVLGGSGAPMRTALAKQLPIVFGFSVPDYFESGWDYTQLLRLPTQDDAIIGGHCVVISGYDFTCQRFPVPAFLCDNSWGSDWGLNGRFWMDYRWFDPHPGLANDLWVIQKVT